MQSKVPPVPQTLLELVTHAASHVFVQQLGVVPQSSATQSIGAPMNVQVLGLRGNPGVQTEWGQQSAIGVCIAIPVDGLHPSVVHGLLSLKVIGGNPQRPLEQTSVVQRLPSSQSASPRQGWLPPVPEELLPPVAALPELGPPEPEVPDAVVLPGPVVWLAEVSEPPDPPEPDDL
jgi:hypothetical protein